MIEDLTPAERQAIRSASLYMELKRYAKSDGAKALTDAFIRAIQSHYKAGLTERKQAERFDAVAAIVGDLVAARKGAQWGRRSLRKNGFTGQRIAYSKFKAAMDALIAEGMVNHMMGYTDRSGFGIVARPSCFQFTQKALHMVMESGVSPSEVDSHFPIA